MGRIRIVERIGSTNTALLADPDAVEGDWLVALAQDGGRGRQGRAWQAPSGNFAGSTLVQLRPGDPSAASLSLACGLALIETLETFVPDAPVELKWPNDVMLGRAKLAGILLERLGDRAVAGFGVNLASAPVIEGRQTAGIFPLASITPEAFAPILAAHFSKLLALWRATATADLARAWQERAHPVGSPLRVHEGPGRVVEGRFDGLDATGALRLRTIIGETVVVHAGDVQLD